MRIAQQLYEGVDVGRGGPVGLITYMRTDSFHCGQEGVGIFFVADLEFVAVDFEQFCHEMFALVLLRRELGEKVPVFFRDKRLDQAFPFTDETQGDGLDAPGAQSFFDFPPEQRAYHITDGRDDRDGNPSRVSAPEAPRFRLHSSAVLKIIAMQ